MSGWLARRSARGRGLIAVLAGAASALALPPLHAVPLLLVTVPCLLALIGRQPSGRGAALIGFWFGLGLNIVGLYWITDAILFEADEFWWLVPLAVPGLSAVLALFIAIPCALAWRARPGWRRVASLCGAWVLADLARQFVATGFPWNPLGSAWAIPGQLGDIFIQPASLIGAHGLTLATLLLSATPSLGGRAMAAGAAGLAAWVGFGVIRLGLPSGPAPAVALVLVQGDIAQGRKWDRAYVEQIFTRYLSLTRDGVAEARRRFPDAAPLPIWPETASPYLLETDGNARAAIVAAAAPSPLALIGSVRFDAEGKPRNSLMAIAPAGPPAAIYDKFHLVPFGEYQPSWLPWPVIIPGGGFAAGPGPRTLRLPGLPDVGALICYEAIFPAAAVEPGRRPQWLVNVTNDAWFGNSSGPRQHLAAARMRAVEEGLPLARAANTGISAVFDARGRELARLGMLREGALVVPLPPADPPTLASRTGLLAPLLLAATLLLAGLGPRRRGSVSQAKVNIS